MHKLLGSICCVISCAASSTVLVGAEGLAIGDSSVVRSYVGFDMSRNFRTIGFFAKDTYKETYNTTISNRYKIDAQGFGLQYKFHSSGMYLEMHTFSSNIKLQRDNAGTVNKKVNWIGAAIGYNYPISNNFSVNGVLSASAPVETVDLKLHKPSSICDGPTQDRFCLEGGKFTNQLRLGLSYSF